jgi:hypothetical protein
MKRTLLPALAAISALSLSACATAPTPYQPAATANGVGYSEYRIEPGRWRVSFRGGAGARPEYVNDLALRRAADLTLADGYDWFRVSDRSIQPLGGMSSGPRFSVGVGGGNYGYRSGVGVGLGTSFGLGGGPAHAATLEVFMGRGPKPAGADVYDARAIISSLGART